LVVFRLTSGWCCGNRCKSSDPTENGQQALNDKVKEYEKKDKDMDKNIVFVSSNLDDERLWKNEINIVQPFWINNTPVPGVEYQVRTRYRAPLVKAMFNDELNKLELKSPVRAITAVQSLVVYDENEVLGGGIVA